MIGCKFSEHKQRNLHYNVVSISRIFFKKSVFLSKKEKYAFHQNIS